ncbi:homing endonuclease [Pseudomonas phage TC6]|uniref:Homing endonuclease n=1 Tax=Pseudomonas phage TC6 TaxID=2060947 RepID=A0A2H5BQF8_9CAUD|nr:homing endonuclease [Pseudomonas phage TC6]
MKIELQSPYKELYKYGYVRKCKDDRARVDLFNSNKDRTTISYAKYVVSVHLARLLDKSEEVDHIDGDKTNDSLENLQVLSKSDHMKKTCFDRKERKSLVVSCAFCSCEFRKWANQVAGKKNLFCSRSCNAKFTRSKGGFKGRAGVAPSVF